MKTIRFSSGHGKFFVSSIEASALQWNDCAENIRLACSYPRIVARLPIAHQHRRPGLASHRVNKFSIIHFNFVYFFARTNGECVVCGDRPLMLSRMHAHCIAQCNNVRAAVTLYIYFHIKYPNISVNFNCFGLERIFEFENKNKHSSHCNIMQLLFWCRKEAGTLGKHNDIVDIMQQRPELHNRIVCINKNFASQ